MKTITLNTKITLDIFKEVIDNKEVIDWFVEQKLENCSFVELVEELVKYDIISLDIIFYNFDFDREILGQLSKNKYDNVREFVASHKNTSLKILKRLSRDKDDEVRGEVAMNENTSLKILKRLSRDKDYEVRQYVAWNDNITIELLEVLSNDSNYWVKKGVAYNKKTSIELLEKLSNDSDVRYYAIKNLKSRKK